MWHKTQIVPTLCRSYQFSHNQWGLHFVEVIIPFVLFKSNIQAPPDSHFVFNKNCCTIFTSVWFLFKLNPLLFFFFFWGGGKYSCIPLGNVEPIAFSVCDASTFLHWQNGWQAAIFSPRNSFLRCTCPLGNTDIQYRSVCLFPRMKTVIGDFTIYTSSGHIPGLSPQVLDVLGQSKFVSASRL